MLKNKEPYLLFFAGKKCKFIRIILHVEFFLCMFFWNKKYIFSYTFDLFMRIGNKKTSTKQISGNRLLFFGPVRNLFFDMGDFQNFGCKGGSNHFLPTTSLPNLNGKPCQVVKKTWKTGDFTFFKTSSYFHKGSFPQTNLILYSPAIFLLANKISELPFT